MLPERLTVILRQVQNILPLMIASLTIWINLNKYQPNIKLKIKSEEKEV